MEDLQAVYEGRMITESTRTPQPHKLQMNVNELDGDSISEKMRFLATIMVIEPNAQTTQDNANMLRALADHVRALEYNRR